MQTNWGNEHFDALREYLAKGMSYSETAKAINASKRPIPAAPPSAAPGEGGLPAPAVPRICPWICPSIGPRRRKYRYRSLPNRANAMYPNSFGRCRFSRARSPSSSAVSRSILAVFRLQISGLRIAVTPTAATKRAKPSPFAVTRAAKVQAIALRIFIWHAAPAAHRNDPRAPSYFAWWRQHEARAPQRMVVTTLPPPPRAFA